ncbi:phage tail assembly protein [Jeongeupia chitinilytica]|uniref:Tail protein n=1 Tax=Jeongeupia chitinilytica TaxID=1041641 RepID=A0ABQ3GXI6_9NEIS|nr:phage tail assembly protein [Jeongeupia chitinilytica]GHD59833.1 tail protein [Jeongeupia chitinilytica]
MIKNVTIELDEPIKRGDQIIASITLRKPNSGALRGLNLTDVMQINVSALKTLLPRISDPTLTEADVDKLDPADLLQLGTEVAGFLVPKRLSGESPDTSTTPSPTSP